MKRLILISFIVGFFVDSLSAQEAFDSVSYAFGNYNMRNAFEANSNLLILTDHEEFYRGLKECMNTIIQDSIYADLYGQGFNTGLFVLKMLIIDPENKPFDLDCVYDGVHKVVSGNVELPQDTIGLFDNIGIFNDMLHVFVEKTVEALPAEGDDCRFGTLFGIAMAYCPQSIGFDWIDLAGPDSIHKRQAFATGIADMLKNDNSYTSGKIYAFMLFSFMDFMFGSVGQTPDYEDLMDGARCALGLSEPKMSIEEVDQLITRFYEESIEKEFTDEEILPEELIEEIKKNNEEEISRQNNPELP
ncbi:MAG: hypothetical protein IKZ92_02925 [Muribaculaceae bacterium]|nr:hypothetical protein [Muribaculaceae bacterium]